MSSTNNLHRRKSSREDDDVVTVTITEPNGFKGRGHENSPRKITISTPESPNNNLNAYGTGAPQRQRVLSTPAHPVLPAMYSATSATPPSAGPYRTNFGNLSPAGPSRSSTHFRNLSIHGHGRTPSASSFYPASPSPLSSSFPPPVGPTQPPSPVAHRPAPAPPTVPQDHLRRHSRIHSRNLSIYFPRPGASLPPASIAEDGAQEIEIGNSNEVPETIISSAPLQQGRELQAGFTFGGKRPKENGVAGDATRPGSASLNGFPESRPSRRGHHHKHSLSHNFFSFMEPEASSFTSGAPTPPISASFSSLPLEPTTAGTTSSPPSFSSQHDSQSFHPTLPPKPVSSILTSSPSLISIAQFILGSALWVRGQGCGSLACTGLGYWVVFDAFGVACTGVLPRYLASVSAQPHSRPYGNARLETLAVFAQSIYLIFASVYVCKEAVEHMLLSHGEGHHHHRGDDTDLGIEFPTILVVVSFLSLIATGIGFDNNSRLINATANRIPSLSSLIQSVRYASKPHFLRPQPPPPTTLVGRAASNPYTALPAGVALSVMFIYGVADVSQHRPADLFLATVLAVLTFGIAYPAALALAKVLLQTAPERGIAGGRMEAFLRTMRDFERHPQILHLPPPHIWQLTPASQGHLLGFKYQESPATLVVTLELHVRRDLDDASVLELTRWAWDRCTGALGGDRGKDDGGGVAEVTIGVVRG